MTEQIETAANRQAAELEHLRKDRDAFRDQRNAVFQTNQRLIAEVEASDQARLRAENETRKANRANLEAAERGQREIEGLRARVAELEAERAKYVGVEPTIAEEMAYLSRCLDAVHQVCDQAVRQATRWENPLPIPDWVETVRQAADGVTEAVATRPALPWAHVMDDADLGMFLEDFISAALGRWRSELDPSDRDILADLEKACTDWRTPGQGRRGNEPGTGEGS